MFDKIQPFGLKIINSSISPSLGPAVFQQSGLVPQLCYFRAPANINTQMPFYSLLKFSLTKLFFSLLNKGPRDAYIKLKIVTSES